MSNQPQHSKVKLRWLPIQRWLPGKWLRSQAALDSWARRGSTPVRRSSMSLSAWWWLEHGFYDFPFSWEWNNHPNWLSLHHFSEGFKPPTSYSSSEAHPCPTNWPLLCFLRWGKGAHGQWPTMIWNAELIQHGGWNHMECSTRTSKISLRKLRRGNVSPGFNLVPSIWKLSQRPASLNPLNILNIVNTIVNWIQWIVSRWIQPQHIHGLNCGWFLAFPAVFQMFGWVIWGKA